MKEIKLNKGYVTLVSDEDYDWLNSFKWCANVQKNGYVRAMRSPTQGIKHTKMHRMILDVTDPKVLVDHKDGNPLNNQRSNLRVCDDKGNACNARSAKNSTSKYLGVSWYKAGSKWMAMISKNYKSIYIGYYQNEEEAALAYNKKAIELHGEFANLNQV